MASVPTEVVRPSEVAGNGPPCTMAWQTSTPVGQPLTRMRPALRSSIGSSARAAAVVRVFHLQGRGQLPFQLLQHLPHRRHIRAADDQRCSAEHLLAERVVGEKVLRIGHEECRLAAVDALSRLAARDLADIAHATARCCTPRS